MPDASPVNEGEAPASGRGALTRDGCAVEVYSRLPPGDDPLIVHRVAGDRGSVLDLGAGVGRIADPLVQLGHRVVAVDNSVEMLDRVRFAATVHSAIETLRLEEQFDVVVLASHLVNTPVVDLRRRLVASVAHHLAAGGRALLQWHPPEWFDGLEARRLYAGTVGDLHSELEVHSLAGDELSATVRYRADGDVWTQDFRACRLTIGDLADLLTTAGLELVDDETAAPGWLLARHAR